MTSRTSPVLLTLLLGAGLAGCGHAPSEPDRPASLYERRLAVIKGTATGIVLIPDREPASAAAAPAAVPASGAGGATTTATASTGSTPTTTQGAPAAASTSKPFSKFLEGLPPPSGRPLNVLKRLDAPDLGIPIPTAASASQPSSK